MPDEHSTEKAASELVGNLPPFFPTAPETGNYRLLQGIAKRFEVEEQDIGDVDLATKLQEALQIEHKLVISEGETYVIERGETEYWTDVENHGELIIEGELIVYDAMGPEGLAVLGELVNVAPKEGESAEHYRARLVAEFTLLTNEGTIRNLLQSAALVLNIGIGNFVYDEPAGSEYGTAKLSIPRQAIDASPLSESEIVSRLDRLLPAGYRLEGAIIGGSPFEYITPDDYNSGNHDATKAYDGLDANGDPKDNGGVYAGLLE